MKQLNNSRNKLDLYEIRQLLNKGVSIYDINLRVTFYARVSTEKEEQLHSIKNQIDYYPTFIKEVKAWEYVPGYYDEGISGKSIKKREDFSRMIDDATAGKFDLILTKEISRFARNTVDSITYTQKLLENNVGVLFESDNINTFLPDSELRLTIMSSIAQDELRKLSSRVKFGFRRSIQNGVVLGNDAIWGYKKDAGKLVVVPEEAEIVRKIFDMYANQKLGMRTIINRLDQENIKNNNGNSFSMSTISRILENPKYKGYYCANKTQKVDYKLDTVKKIDEDEWVLYKDTENVPQIVSEELWDKANMLKNRRKNKKDTCYQNRYTYSGKIICGEHNVTYHRSVFKYKSGDKELWQCQLYKNKGKSACDSPSIYTSELNSIMKDVYEKLVINKTDIIAKMIDLYKSIDSTNDVEKNVARIENKINDILENKDSLLRLYSKDKINEEEFEARNKRFNENLDILQQELKRFEEEKVQRNTLNKNVNFLRKSINNELNFEEFNSSIIDNILDKIIVHKTENSNVINLDIMLKIINKNFTCELVRSKGYPLSFSLTENNTSECTTSCT